MSRQVGAARVLRAAAAAGLLMMVVLGSGVHGVAAPAAASVTGACTDDTGVTVVVDFPGAGNVQTRCAGWPVSSGLDALAKAGFSSTPVQQQPQFVCRIDGVPAEDKCVVTPPDDAFWSYWTAQRGGTWAFSATGAATSDPAQGAVEGWAFGAAAPPEISPPAAPEPPDDPPSSPSPPPAPPTSAPLPSQPPVEPPDSDDSGDSGDPAAPEISATSEAPAPSASLTAAAPTTAVTSSTSATAAISGPSTTGPTSAAVAGDAPPDDGSPTGTLVAIGVVVALGAATGVTAWRRRSAAS